MTEAKADILITGSRVMLPGGDPQQPAACDIRVRDGRIMAIEPALDGPAAAPGANPLSSTPPVCSCGPASSTRPIISTTCCRKASWRICRSTSERRTPSQPISAPEAREVQLRMIGSIDCIRYRVPTVQDMSSVVPLTNQSLALLCDVVRDWPNQIWAMYVT